MKQLNKLCLTGVGIGLFVALSMCLRVPVFENYYLCLGYIVMAVWLNSVGIFSGTAVGTLGTILYCVLIGGLRGMPGWALGNIVIGLNLGVWFQLAHYIKSARNRMFVNLLTSVMIIFISAFGILGVKSVVEMLLYGQPFLVRVVSNFNAFVADAVVLIISVPICNTIHTLVKKYGLIAQPFVVLQDKN